MTPIRGAFAAVAGFAVGYVLPAALRLPVLAYDPVSRAVFFASAPSGMQMRYYGDLLWAIAFALAALALSLISRPRTSLAIVAATSLSLVAFDVAYYLSRLLAALR